MSEILSEEWQQHIANTIAHWAEMTSRNLCLAQDDAMRPHVLMRPNVFPDGNQWCALYGENLQEGVAGFGDTPERACAEFDANWLHEKAGLKP